MTDRREASARSPDAAELRTSPGRGPDRERVLLLECRLEQMRAALATARDEADHVRSQLSDVAARETEHARRYCMIHEELAEARAEIAVLHRHLDRSEALRAEIAGHLFEGGVGEDTEELIKLRRRALAEDQRAMVSDRTVTRLRARVEELIASRETLLTRIAEWQQLIRKEGPDAADLSEFLAELRREILDLERRGQTADAREARLRDRLALAGIDPDESESGESLADPDAVDESEEHAEPQEEEATAAGEPTAADEPEGTAAGGTPEPESEPEFELESEAGLESEPDAVPVVVEASAAPTSSRTDSLVAELLDAQLPELRADLLLRLGRTGDTGAAHTVHPWTKSSEPSVRAAAYEALGRLLEREPEALEPHLRRGLSDADARVRRRVVLAAATARGLDPHALLDALREDSDAQVRRLIRQVLRQAPSAGAPSGPSTESASGATVSKRPSRV